MPEVFGVSKAGHDKYVGIGVKFEEYRLRRNRRHGDDTVGSGRWGALALMVIGS